MKRRRSAAVRRLLPRQIALNFADRTLAIWADRRGVAAVEFGLFAIFLSLALANVADVSIYIYQRMQAENATQAAVQAAWKACDVSHLPATTNCPGLTTAVQNAVKSTSLGTSVALVSGSPSEGYYCVNSSNALQHVSNVSSKPADCTAAGMPSLQPGDYIKVQTTFMRRYFPVLVSPALSQPQSTEQP